MKTDQIDNLLVGFPDWQIEDKDIKIVDHGKENVKRFTDVKIYSYTEDGFAYTPDKYEFNNFKIMYQMEKIKEKMNELKHSTDPIQYKNLILHIQYYRIFNNYIPTQKILELLCIMGNKTTPYESEINIKKQENKEKRLIENRKITNAKFNQLATQAKHKSIDVFISDLCVLNKKYKIQSSILHKQYIKWYENLDENHELKKMPLANSTDFSPHIINKYDVQKKKQSVNILYGIITKKELEKDEIRQEIDENIYSEEIKELKRIVKDQQEEINKIQQNITLLCSYLQQIPHNEIIKEINTKIEISNNTCEKNKNGKRKEKENLAHLSDIDKKERKKLTTKLNYYETKSIHTNTDKSKIAEIYEELQKYDKKNYCSDEKIFL